MEEAIEYSREELDDVFKRSDDEDSVYEEVLKGWGEYADELKHEWAKLGFVTNPLLIDEVLAYPDQQDLLASSRRIVRKIFFGCEDMDRVLTEFSSSLTLFQDKAGGWDEAFIWNDPLLSQGKAHIWHRQYSLPHAEVFGKVGCVAQGQLTGMGAAERNWAHVKNIWDDAKANMTAEKAEKEVKIWEGIRREELAIRNDLNPIDVPLYRQWTDDQVNFDLGLDKRGVEIDTTAVDERRFLNYMEDWEGKCIKKKNST